MILAEDRRLLYSLAQARSDPESIAAVAALRKPEHLVGFLDEAERQEVFVPVARALIGALGNGVLPTAHHRLLARRLDKRSRLEEEMVACTELLDRLDVPAAFLKGFSTERAYGTGYVRQFDDLDIAVADLDAFWVFAAALEHRGFSVQGLLLGYDRETEQWVGVAHLASIPPTPASSTIQIEVKIGGMCLHWASWIMLDRMFWSEREQLERQVWVPSCRHNLLIFLAEMLERPRLRVRDQLDISALSTDIDHETWDWLSSRAMASSLGYELALVERFVAQGADSERRWPKRWASSLAGRWSREWNRDLTRALFHDLPFALARRGVGDASLTTLRCVARDRVAQWSHKGRYRRLRLAARLNERLPARDVLSAGMVVQFAPFGREPRGSFGWYGHGTDELLVSPVGPLLPMLVPVWTSKTQSRVEQARRSMQRDDWC